VYDFVKLITDSWELNEVVQPAALFAQPSTTQFDSGMCRVVLCVGYLIGL
jgi:hypothetical protein